MGTPAPRPSALPRWASLDFWVASAVYTVGERVINDSPGKIYVCTVAGESDSSGGPTGTGGAITDNEVTWAYVSDAADAWVGATPYAEGDRVINGGNLYACIVAGTSAGSGGPTTTNTNGINQIVDGTVTWVFLSAATALITEPNATKKDVGHLVGERPPAQYENWIKNSTYRWLRWLKDWSLALLFDTVPTHRAEILKIALFTANGHTVYGRIIASKDGSALELTVNAAPDGTGWVSDDDLTKAFRITLNYATASLYYHAAAASWSETGGGNDGIGTNGWAVEFQADPSGSATVATALDFIAKSLAVTGNISTTTGSLILTLGEAFIGLTAGATYPQTALALGHLRKEQVPFGVVTVAIDGTTMLSGANVKNVTHPGTGHVQVTFNNEPPNAVGANVGLLYSLNTSGIATTGLIRLINAISQNVGADLVVDVYIEKLTITAGVPALTAEDQQFTLAVYAS